jgi:membrane-associated phospholipid phosphatase
VAAKRSPYFPLDLVITRAVQQDHGDLFDAVMHGLSWIGFMPQVMAFAAAVILVLWRLGLRAEAAALCLAGAGSACVTLIKLVVRRPRPADDLVEVAMRISESSFPSGHVFMFTAFCGFLAYLAFTLLAATPWRTLLPAVLLALPALMGLSRIDLGHHWFSDVMGGHVLGALWLACVIRIYRWGKPRWFVRQPVAPPAPGKA